MLRFTNHFYGTKTIIWPLILPQHAYTKDLNQVVYKLQIIEQLKSQHWEKEQFPFLQIV